MKKILLFSALALTTLSFGQNIPSYVPTNGLVGWYPFNGNANDESGNGNDRTVNGPTLSIDRTGVPNSAYSFDGINDYMEGSTNSNLNVDNFTFSCWVSMNSTSGNKSIGGSYANPNGYHIRIIDGTVKLRVHDGYLPSVSSKEVVSTTNLSTNNWYNLTFTCSQTGLMIYVNGVLEDTTLFGSWDFINESRLRIGCASWDFSEYFNGNIDDIAIYNRALTQQEVTALYNSCTISATTIGSISSTTSGNNITMSATSNGSNINYTWETNPINNGWQEVVSNSTYSGNGTSSLSISNLTLANHQQPFRVIVSDNSCSDTSDVAYITLTDTCINTTSIAVTDTLIMDISLAGVSAPNDVNTMKIYPNPTNDIVNIDNGNYTLMTGYSIKIMTAIGQEMFSSSITSQTIQVPVSQLGATGNYFINVYDNNQVLVESKVLILE